MCRWYVAVPVQVTERSGILASFSRSAELTRGVRWSIFGALLVVGLIGIVIFYLSTTLAGFAGRVGLILGGTVVGTTLTMLNGCLLHTAAYLELREIREGAMSEDLVSVFN